MIEVCMKKYSQSSSECDSLATWIGSKFIKPDLDSKNTSYTNTARAASVVYLGMGSCCIIGGHNLAPLFALPGVITLATSELPTCTICIANACRQAIHTHKNQFSTAPSLNNKEVVPLN
ncbi:MAG: hypothetical protein V4489_07175 [Chlamydiota bacterium]